jgi:hypothetical protein
MNGNDSGVRQSCEDAVSSKKAENLLMNSTHHPPDQPGKFDPGEPGATPENAPPDVSLCQGTGRNLRL